MKKSIDQLLIILSLDCFEKYLWKPNKNINIEKIKEIARDEFKKILDGGSNYYMDANFSEYRLKQTQENFYKRIAEFLETVQIDYIKTIQLRIEDDTSSAFSNIATPILSDLLWLNHKSLSNAIDEDLLKILSKIEDFGISIQTPQIEKHEIKLTWKNSNSDWDKFMKQESMFEDIDDVPCLILYKALRLDPATIFIQNIHSNLDKQDFLKIINFLILEVDSNKTIYNQDDVEHTKSILISYLQ